MFSHCTLQRKDLTLKDYIVINCSNPSFYVYVYSKEYSQNFMDHSFSLFRLLKNFLRKH